MVLDWKKVVLIVAVLATFTALAVLRLIPNDVISMGVTALLGWLAGLFTPAPTSRPAPPPETAGLP
jgi:hypothetical protein